MQKAFTVLSPEEFKKNIKTASHNVSSKTKSTIEKAQTAQQALDTVAPADARVEFVSNCRALGIKPNTILLQNIEAVCTDEVLTLAENYVGSIGLQALTPLIAKNTNLKNLILPRNGLTNNAVIFLCRSLRAHPNLRSIDLSCNRDISLAGGLALLTLVKQCPGLVNVDLVNTQVPIEVLNKITNMCRVKHVPLDTPRSAPLSSIPVEPVYAAVAATATAETAAGAVAKEKPFGSRAVVAAPSLPAQGGKAKNRNKDPTSWDEKERSILCRLEERLRKVNTSSQSSERVSLLPDADFETGWSVLEVAILTLPRLFRSELEQLLEVVFPRLNEELYAQKILLLPLVVSCGGVPEHGTFSSRQGPTVRPEFRYTQFTCVCDILADVRRSRYVTIELLGDRQGDYEQAPMFLQPSTKLLEKIEQERAESLRPVLYTAHSVAVESSRYLIVAIRKDTKFIGMPPAMAPLLSAEPRVENPDSYHSVVKKILPPFSGLPSGELLYDRAVEERAWLDHLSFRANVVSTIPIPELLIYEYPCTFKEISESGNVRLQGLEGFTNAVYQRLRLLIFTAISEANNSKVHRDKTAPARLIEGTAVSNDRIQYLLKDVLRRRREKELVLDRLISCNNMKKALSDQLNLYLVSPISRSSFTICATDEGMLTAVLASTAATAMGHAQGGGKSKVVMRNYTPQLFAAVAFHSTRTTRIHDEPTDLHMVMRQILAQLTTNSDILEYLALEVDTDRLRSFFVQFLSGTSAIDSKVRLKALRRQKAHASEAGPGECIIPDCNATTLAMLETGDKLNSSSECSASQSNGQPNPPMQQERIFAVMLDGIEDIDAPIKLADVALAPSHAPNPSALSEDSTKQETKGSSALAGWGCGKVAPEDLLPKYLARNVRMIIGCSVAPNNKSGEMVAEKLQGWSRDSMVVLNASLSTIDDPEQLLSATGLAEFGLSLTDKEVEMARAKYSIHEDPEYLNYLIDALRINAEETRCLSQTQLLNEAPETTEGMAERVYDRLVDNFGGSLVYKLLGLLRAARWGIPEVHLRGLIKLPPQEFRRLIRHLSVVTELPRLFWLRYAQQESDLVQTPVRLVSPAFKSLLDRLEAKRGKTSPSPTRLKSEMKLGTALDGELMDRRVWHDHLASYYLSILGRSLDVAVFLSLPTVDNKASTSSLSPYERYAVKELPFHLAQACMWKVFDSRVLSTSYLMMVYRHQLAYAYLRDLTAAFNHRHAEFLNREGEFTNAKNDTTQSDGCDSMESVTKLPLPLVRLHEYINFVRKNSHHLLRYPEAVLQVCVAKKWDTSGCVCMDAHAFILQIKRHAWRAQQPEKEVVANSAASNQVRPTTPSFDTFSWSPRFDSMVYFKIINAEKSNSFHLGPVACMQFTPNHKFLITGSSDRTLCWIKADASASLLYRVCQPSKQVDGIACCRLNNGYIGALREDRSFQVYDAFNGNVVSDSTGRDTQKSIRSRAPVSKFCFSAHGRYYFIATEDLALRVYDSENSFLVSELCWRDLMACQAAPRSETTKAAETSVFARRSYIQILTHPYVDEHFTSVVNEKLRVWRVLDSKDACNPVWGELLELSGQVRQAEWLPIQSPHRACEEEAIVPKANMLDYPYVLVIYVEHQCNAELWDLFHRCAVRSFVLPSLTASVRFYAYSEDHVCLALATSEGAVHIYSLQDPVNSCSSVPFHTDTGANGEDSSGIVMNLVAPYVTLNAFLNPYSPEDPFWGLSFCEGRSALLTLGNGVELKYWALPSIDECVTGVEVHPNPTLPTNRVDRVISQPHGQIRLHARARCWCATSGRVLKQNLETVDASTATEYDKCFIAIGDENGCVTLLNIWKP